MRAGQRLFLPALVLASMVAVALGVFVRGAWCDAAPLDPSSVQEEPTARVVQLPDGTKEVCAAVRLPYSLEEVWEAITDYDHYGDICSCLRATDVQQGPLGCKVVGRAKTPFPGGMPFTLELKHEQDLFEYRSTWDDVSGDVLVNRGGWVARPIGDRETLLMLRLEVQVRGVPTFLLRNLSRYRLCEVLRAVRRRLTDGPTGRPWG